MPFGLCCLIRATLAKATILFNSALVGLLIAGCNSQPGSTTTTASTTTARTPETAPLTTVSNAEPTDLDQLIAAAQAEGTLTTIGLPHAFCNYGEIISAFEAKYGLDVNDTAPLAESADTLEALRAAQQGAEGPDVIDIWIVFGPEARAEGLLSPYRVTTWNQVPGAAKDLDGYWYGGYFGVLAFEANDDFVDDVPTDWMDLMDGQYQGKVALAGDPRVSNQAILSVTSASLGSGGSLDEPRAGLDFFAELNSMGNLTSVIADSETVVSGETPVTIRWTYNALANRDANSDLTNIEVVVPASGAYAGVYIQAISAFAAHPNAAKLWMEFLYSDEGQNLWLSGFCYPIRYEVMAEQGIISQERSDVLPEPSYVVFPSIDQINAASELVASQWDSVVGLEFGDA